MLEGLTTAKELLKDTSDIAYVNFIDSIRAEQSKKKYAYLLDLYIEFLNLKGGRNELSLLLDQNAKTIGNSIISYILKLKRETQNDFIRRLLTEWQDFHDYKLDMDQVLKLKDRQILMLENELKEKLLEQQKQNP